MISMNQIQCNLVISGPNFVSSFAYQDYVFFFYRETAVEYMNCGKVRDYDFFFSTRSFLIPNE